MALVPVMGVDLFELANNHLWRTEFGFTNRTTPAPAWVGLPNEGRSGSEKDCGPKGSPIRAGVNR